MQKPDTCRGCVLYDDGQGFVPGVFPEGATVLLLGQNPGDTEEKRGVPLVGKTGGFVDTLLLPLAGVDVVAKDNVLRCRWRDPKKGKKVNDLPAESVSTVAMAHCSQYDPAFDEFTLVVAMGALALKKMGGPALKMHEWRGHCLPEKGETG